MIRVTIELVPGGILQKRSTLYIVDVANRGAPELPSSSDERSYEVRIDEGEWMEGVNHYRTQGVMKLLSKVFGIL